jgi:hypothetical protein
MLAVRRAAAFNGPPERKDGRRARTSSGPGCGLVARSFVSSFVARSAIVRVKRHRPSIAPCHARSGPRRADLSVVNGGARIALSAAAAVAALVIALASGVKELPGTWRWLSGQRNEFESMSDFQRAQEPGTAQLLPVDAFDFFHSKVGEGDTYFLAVRSGGFAAGVDRATAGRIFSRFYLLPAVQVDLPAKAAVVLTVGVDPHSLGVPLGPVSKFAGGNYFAARVKR